MPLVRAHLDTAIHRHCQSSETGLGCICEYQFCLSILDLAVEDEL
jgi:hypothetical protein